MSELSFTLQQKAAFWFMVIEIIRRAHRARFPKRQLGSDLETCFVVGAAVVIAARGEKIRATNVGHYLEMPRESARRHLVKLVDLGLFRRKGAVFEYQPESLPKLPNRGTYFKLFADAMAKLL